MIEIESSASVCFEILQGEGLHQSLKHRLEKAVALFVSEALCELSVL